MPKPVRSRSLLVIADDLTGALDTACEFAGPGAPVEVTWPDRHDAPPRFAGRAAHSTESRELDARQAARAVRRHVPGDMWRDMARDVWFKKIDSVMRGHPVAELAAWMRAGAFPLAILAPAFPDQGRRTVCARQSVWDGNRWRPVGPPLVAALRAQGLDVLRGRDGLRRWNGRAGVLVLDATSQRDLDAQVRVLAMRLRRAGRPVLWCGTGGLAHALGPRAASLRPPALPLIVAGTRHPRTLSQLERLPDGWRPTIMTGAPLPEPHPRSTALLVADPAADGAREAGRATQASLASLAGWAPRAAFVTGGETLHRLCTALGASALSCHGRVAPGISLSRFVGGAWDGQPVVAKSGGFGEADLLTMLVDRTG